MPRLWWTALVLGVVLAFSSIASTARAEPTSEEEKTELIEELTYMQHPGLPPASSKIFFSKRPWTISGFGEISYTHYLGNKNRASRDIELYNTNLYRFVLYGAYKPTSWLVLYAEGFAEVFHDGLEEIHYEVLPEVFADFLLTNPTVQREGGPHIGPFNARVGFIQLPIGYINTNDEPVMFYSVNRPEVERVIIPSQWVELGAQVYGKIGPRLQWLLLGFQGVDGSNLNGATWVRQGRNPGYELKAPALAAQVIATPVDHLDLSVSGVLMESGNGGRVPAAEGGGLAHRVSARTALASAWARLELGNWTLMGLGAMGWMDDTASIWELTKHGGPTGQIVGARSYGWYFELGCDVLPYLRKPSTTPSHSLFYRSNEVALPFFARYERLDTHAEIDPALAARIGPEQPLFRSDLDVLTLGVNFRPRRSLVLKADYQLRHNRAAGGAIPREGDHIEVGAGIIF